jgi:hypothetical protein
LANISSVQTVRSPSKPVRVISSAKGGELDSRSSRQASSSATAEDKPDTRLAVESEDSVSEGDEVGAADPKSNPSDDSLDIPDSETEPPVAGGNPYLNAVSMPVLDDSTFSVAPVPLEPGGLEASTDCFAFRDNGKGVLMRFTSNGEGEGRIGLQYITKDPVPRKQTLVDVKRSSGARFWRLRLDKIREQVSWMRPVGCISARHENGVFGVAYKGEFVRVGVYEDELLLARGTSAPVVIARLESSGEGTTQTLTGVYLHPKGRSVLVVVRGVSKPNTQAGLLVDLNSLERFPSAGVSEVSVGDEHAGAKKPDGVDSPNSANTKVHALPSPTGPLLGATGFKVSPVLMEPGGLQRSADCFGFRDDGKGVLFRFNYRNGERKRIGLEYLATSPRRLRRRLVNVALENAGAYWRERLDSVRRHVGWLVLRGCVEAREAEGVFTVRHHQEHVRVSTLNGRVIVTRGADESVPVRELSDGKNGLQESVSGVFMHPKHPSILIVLDRSGGQVFAQDGLFMELDDLASNSLDASAPQSVFKSKKDGDEPVEAPNEALVETESSALTKASDEDGNTQAKVGVVDEQSEYDTIVLDADDMEGEAPEAATVGRVTKPGDGGGLWFLGKDLNTLMSPCIGFAPNGGSAFTLLRRFDQSGKEWKSVQRLSRDPAVPPHALFTARSTEFVGMGKVLSSIEGSLELKHLAQCIDGTRRSDRLWFAAYRGRPVLLEAGPDGLTVTGQSSEPRLAAPLVPGEKITHVFQHPSLPVAMVLLGIGDNSPLPQRAVLVSIGYAR